MPPPAVSVSAAPAPTQEAAVEAEAPKEKKPRDPRLTYTVAALCAVALLVVFYFSPGGLLGHFMVFMLSVVVGFYVIGNVSHSLHTPLMSVTNAISGIIVVGCLSGLALFDQALPATVPTNLAIVVLSLSGILLASINVFGGFTVTQRMLQMFRKG